MFLEKEAKPHLRDFLLFITEVMHAYIVEKLENIDNKREKQGNSL